MPSGIQSLQDLFIDRRWSTRHGFRGVLLPQGLVRINGAYRYRVFLRMGGHPQDLEAAGPFAKVSRSSYLVTPTMAFALASVTPYQCSTESRRFSLESSSQRTLCPPLRCTTPNISD